MNDKKRWVMEWFKKGDHDLRAAEAILRLQDPPLDIVCFHAQQCVEKYLKGFLSFYEIEVLRTHDLVELLTKCGNIDPSFIKFYNWIRENKIQFVILSDGFKTYINRIFQKNNIQVAEEDIKSNDMELVEGKIKLKFLTPECKHDCANCKYSHVKQFKDRGNKIIYIGDGLSDIFPARELADMIFAKENEDLATELKKDSRLIVFENFANLMEKITLEFLLNKL